MPAPHDAFDHSLRLMWQHDPEALIRLLWPNEPHEWGPMVGGEVVHSLRRAADGARRMRGATGE